MLVKRLEHNHQVFFCASGSYISFSFILSYPMEWCHKERLCNGYLRGLLPTWASENRKKLHRFSAAMVRSQSSVEADSCALAIQLSKHSART